MSAYPYIPVATEDQLWGEIETRRRQMAATRATVTSRQAALASGLSQSYPWLDPGITQSLTLAGFPANSAQARAVATMAAVTTAQDGGFDDPAPEVPDGFFDALWQVSGEVGKVALNGLKAAMAVGGFLYEELGEAVIPAFGQAEMVTPNKFTFGRPDIGFDFGPIDDLLEVPHMVANTIAQKFSGEFWSNFWSAYTEQASPSTLRLAIGDIAATGSSPFFGFDADQGEGIIGNFNRRQELRARLQLAPYSGTPESASTLGRITALELFEPDSWAYKILSGAVDFGANVATPLDLGLGDVAKGAGIGLSAADRITMGGKVGLLPGITKRVDLGQAIDSYLTSRPGQEWAQWLADTDDVGAIWNNIGRVSPSLAEELARTSDINAIMGTLRHTLGTQIRDIPTAGPIGRTAGTILSAPLRPLGSALPDYARTFGPGAAVFRSFRNIRAIHEVPGAKFNPHDLAGSAKTLHDYVRNAKMGDDILNKYLTRMAGIEAGDSTAFLNLSIDLGTDTIQHLVNREASVFGRSFTIGQARSLTKIYRDATDDFRLYFIDAQGRNVDVLGAKTVTIDGENIPSSFGPTVHMLSELIDGAVPLPGSARELKRATSFMSRVWDIPGVEGSVEFADWILGNIWKPFQLVTRFAYPVRVLGEEQVRLAAVGMDSLFTHPWSYIQWMTSRRGGKDLEEALFNTGVEGRFGPRLDLIQEASDFKSAMARGSAGWAGLPGEILTGRFVRATRNDGEKFYQGAGVELQQMASEPVMQRIAGGLGKGDLESIGRGDLVTAQAASALKEAVDTTGTLPGTAAPAFTKVRDIGLIKEWFWSGGGKAFREELGTVKGKEILAESHSGARQAADEYIDSYLNRLNIKTGQNPDLINAVATGKLGKVNLLNVYSSKKLTKALEDYDDALPAYVKVEETIAGRTSILDRAVTTMFSAMMTRPTNTLSRSPFFRQAYNEEIERLMGFATVGVQEKVVRYARDVAKLSRNDQLRLTRIMGSTSGDRITSLAEMDTLAKAFALGRTRDLLYDLSKRNQFFDAFRHVFPFGDAWKEIMSAWTKILSEHPGNLRRFQQGVQGALGPGFGELTSQAFGTGTTPGQGFIYTDPQTKELMFNYPGSELVSGVLLGTTGQASPDAQVTLSGNVAGLNLFSATVLPGMGPSVQWPMAAFGDITGFELPQGVHDIVFPFGEPDLEQGFLEENFYPAWLQKLTTALFADPETTRIYGNTVADVMRALVRTGKYSNDTPEAQQELLDAGKSRARALMVIRALAQSSLPTGPSVRWSQADVQGNLVPIVIMAEEYRRLLDQYEGDSDKALTEWLRTFGTENLLALQGKTKEVLYRPLDEESYGWIRENPELEQDYRLTIGFFAPDPTEGSFDYSGYLRTIDDETRQVLRPRDQLQLSNDFLGTIAYEQAKSQVRDRTDVAANMWLAEVKEMLRQRFPGFDDQLPVKSPPKTSELIEELVIAANDPRLADTPAAQAINLYQQARLAAQEIVDNNRSRLNGSQSYTSSASTQFLRDWLRSVAQELIGQYPEFREAYQRVYRNEFQNRDED